MIHVERQPEPRPPEFDFDREVRQPGRSALSELTGQGPSVSRRGPRIGKKADRLEDLNPEVLRKYAYWTRALDALHKAYRGVCAYSCFYIEPLCGPTVDHFVAIARTGLEEAYEWDNYRLACSLMNACKREFPDVLDPFKVDDGWFELDLNTLEVKPGSALPSDLQARINETIRRLHLNDRDCRLTRERYFNLYWKPDDPSRPMPLWFFEKQAPFLARELRRQGRIRPEDRIPRQ